MIHVFVSFPNYFMFKSDYQLQGKLLHKHKLGTYLLNRWSLFNSIASSLFSKFKCACIHLLVDII